MTRQFDLLSSSVNKQKSAQYTQFVKFISRYTTIRGQVACSSVDMDGPEDMESAESYFITHSP